MMQYKDKKKGPLITCPCCGYEYFPAEIYVPNAFFGHPEDIDRTSEGKIDIYEGTNMDLTEEFTCDRCGSTFKVEATVRFKTTEKKEEPKFSSTWTSPLHPTKLSMPEPEGEFSLE